MNFPTDTLSPTSRLRKPDAFHGEWHFASLVSTSAIGIELPQLLNPGPLATKVTLFAPVSLLFFFFVVAVLSQVSGHELHPMHSEGLGAGHVRLGQQIDARDWRVSNTSRATLLVVHRGQFAVDQAR